MSITLSQENIISTRGVEFSVRITIVDEKGNKVTKNAEVAVNGTVYTFPDFNGRYIAKANVGDQLRVSHPDFQTIYYTLKSSEDIEIVVADYVYDSNSSSKFISKSKRTDFYLQYLDSAKFFQKKDINKSLSFIEKALVHDKNTIN